MGDVTQDKIRHAAKSDPGLSFGNESPLRSLARETLHGMTLGWNDELTGAMGAVPAALSGQNPIDAYKSIRDAERSAHRDTQTASPIGTAAIDLGSAAVPGVGLAKLSSKLASKVTSPVVKKVMQSPIAQGTELGAVAGAGDQQGDAADTAGAAALGGVTGGAATAGLVVIAKGLHALIRGMGWANPDKDAAKLVMEAMKKDGLDPQVVLSKAAGLSKETGKPVTLADVVGSDNAAGATGQLFNQALGKAGGTQRAGIIHGMEDRQAGQKERVITDFARGANATQMEIEPMVDELIKVRKEASQPLYDIAYAKGEPIQDDRLTALFGRPSVQSAFKNLKGYAAETNTPIDASFAKDPDSYHPSLLTGDSKGGKFEVITPNLRSLDIIKKRLWDLEQRAKITENGQLTPTMDSMAIGDTRRTLTGLLDELGPEEYKQARNVYSDYSSMKDAAEFGYDIFKKSPAAIHKQLAGYTEAERDAFVSGLYGHLTDLTQKDGANWSAKLLGDSRKREQLKSIFGDDRQDQFETFMKQLQAESMQAKAAKTFTGPQPTDAKATDNIGAILHAGPSGIRPTLYDSAKLKLSSATMPPKTAKALTTFAFTPRVHDMVDNIMANIRKGTPPYRGGYSPAGAYPLMQLEQQPQEQED